MAVFLTATAVRFMFFLTYLLLIVFAGLYHAQQKAPSRSVTAGYPFQPRLNPGVSVVNNRNPTFQSFGTRIGPGVGGTNSNSRNSGSRFGASAGSSLASRSIGSRVISTGSAGGSRMLSAFGGPEVPVAVSRQSYPTESSGPQFQLTGAGSSLGNRRSQTQLFAYQQQQIPLEPTYALCGGHIWLQDEAPRSVQSPNYPYPYPNDTYCEWRIFAGFGTQLRINATDFALESSETCKSDYVQFFWANGNPSTWNVKKGEVERFCGNEGPRDLVFKDNNLVMTLVTDRSRTNRGFNISFMIFHTCAILFDQPDFRGSSTTLEQFYESTVLPSYSENIFTSVEISQGCKLMVCSDDHFEGTCHLYFRTNRNIAPLHINWPRSASCLCS